MPETSTAEFCWKREEETARRRLRRRALRAGRQRAGTCTRTEQTRRAAARQSNLTSVARGSTPNFKIEVCSPPSDCFSCNTVGVRRTTNLGRGLRWESYQCQVQEDSTANREEPSNTRAGTSPGSCGTNPGLAPRRAHESHWRSPEWSGGTQKRTTWGESASSH